MKENHEPGDTLKVVYQFLRTERFSQSLEEIKGFKPCDTLQEKKVLLQQKKLLKLNKIALKNFFFIYICVWRSLTF